MVQNRAQSRLQVSGAVPPRQPCAFTPCVAAPCDLPVHQAQRVNVGTLEGIKVFHVDGLIQNLRGHIPATGQR